jgi:hypothetical protein
MNQQQWLIDEAMPPYTVAIDHLKFKEHLVHFWYWLWLHRKLALSRVPPVEHLF